MGNVREEKMSEHVQLYFHQRNLSQVLSTALEHNVHGLPFKSSKMGIKSDPLLKRKLRAGLNGASRRIDVGLPIDLSKRGGKAEVTIESLEMGLSDEESDNCVGNGVEEEMEEEFASDEPLNLSVSGGKNGEKSKAKDLEKRVRLEEMVSYIRKCSVVEETKYRTGTSGYSAVESEPSATDSENGDERPLNARASVDNCRNHDESTSGHRRISYQSGVLRGGTNGEVLRASYPVLRQQLLRSVSEDAPEVDEESGSEVGSDVDAEIMAIQRRSTALNMNENSSGEDIAIVPHPHWSTYAYYATMAAAAAAQGLLMTATAANNESSEADKSTGESAQPPQTESNSATLLRKRAPRALTGKHVKHGTGASPATLLTLRQKIEQKMNQQPPEAKSNGKRALAVKRSNKRKVSV